MKEKISFLFFLLLFQHHLYAQVPVKDTTNELHIIKAGKMIGGSNNTEILSGGVQLSQGNTLFTCDSCILDANGHVFEAFRHVYIDDSDTAKIWSDHLRYLTDKKMAYFDGNVKLSDGHAVLTTKTLEYDVASKIGTYKDGGKVVNNKSVLTSREGIYYADIRDFYFKNNVELKDPGYTLKADSLLYNTETQLARFIANTYIKDSSGRVIRTKEGYYDLHAGRAQFTQRTTIVDKTLIVSGDRIASDDSTGIVQIEGRGVMIDSSKGLSILADRFFINKKTDALLATKKPLMIIKQENDSFFVAADTIFSARISDLRKDTIKNLKSKGKTDSTDRYLEAYRHVRIFSDSMQAVSDSLFYSFKDSAFRLFQNPVVWSRSSQIKGDTILLFTKNKKPDWMRVFNNSFLASEVEHGVYNQIKSSRMNAYFKNGVIDTVIAKGLAESIYFLQDKDSAFTSVNQTSSDAINIYFDKGDLYKVVLLSAVKGDLTPIKQKNPTETKLPNFQWLEDRRPKTKFELFE